MSSKKMKSLTDEELVKLLSTRKSNEALTELHARYGKKVLGFFIYMLKEDRDKAQDFVQELFIRILEKHHQFNPERKFSPWMFAIASNLCKTEFRKPSDQRISSDAVELNEQAEWSENNFDKIEFRKALELAISNLEEHHRETFILRYMEELSIKEIAVITSMSEGTVKSRLFYATKIITERLKEFKPSNEGSLFKMN